MKNKILTLIATLTILTVSAQVQLDNTVLHNNGATIFITGASANTISNGSVINNNGIIYFDGNFTQTNANDTLTNQALTDTIYVSGNLNIVNGNYDGDNQYGNGYQGAVVFNGTTAQVFNTRSTNSDNLYNIEINNTSATGVNLNGTAIATSSIRFTDGLFFTAAIDTLALVSDGNIVGTPGITSHINGAFYREGNSTVSDLFYPIGDGIRYRPATLKNVPIGAPYPIIGFEVINGATGGTAGLGVDNIIDTRHWHAQFVKGDYQGSQLELSYGAVEGVTNQNNLIVAQSNAVAGTYKSLDQSATSGINALGTVTSQYNVGQSFFTIGESANMRVDLTAFLEGNYVAVNTMHDSLRTNIKGNYLENRYLFQPDSTNPYGIEMLKNYNPPIGAVDVVRLTIRSIGAPTTDIDETFAWLMIDGSIRDFSGGELSYATFKDLSLVPGNDYTIVVWHRNHVPMMYTASGEIVDQNTATPAYFDLSNPINVYGAGYKDLTGVSAMYAGNAEQTITPYYINALDLWVVGNSANNNMPAYYINTDVNLDGKTNNSDWTIAKWANDQLYYSTIP